MSLELVNTLATFGTFVVIAATAIAALVQLRHARSSNQIEALAELYERMESVELQSAVRSVASNLADRLRDPAFRYQLAHREAMTAEAESSGSETRRVANFYENMGALVKNGLADRNLVLEIFSGLVQRDWETVAPVVALVRLASGNPGVWENFEYLEVLSEDWEAAHPQGTYPAGVRRIDLKYPWLEADKQYVASLAPA
jgi:Domain of unknown function (DUF4760)